MHYGKCVLLAMMVFMTACKAEQGDAPLVDDAAVSAATASESTASPAESPNTAGTAMDSNQPPDANAPSASGEAPVPGIKAGMAYADFSKLLAANGWVPVPTPECTANVVGGDHESVCKATPDQITCKICQLMPELDSYSGDGFALVRFKHASSGEVLEATGYGMIEDWNVAGDNSRLQLERWESIKAAGK